MQNLESLQERQSTISKRVETLSGEAAEVEDKLQEVLEALDVKSGGRDGSDSTNALVRMKEGIKELKEETAEMNMRIGVLAASLLAIKSRNMKESTRKQRIKASAKRRGKGRQADGDYDKGVEGVDLDDE
jgi:uncharacterized coiled-coil DUF342 family protein